MNDLTHNIRNWAIYRGLDQADPHKQFLKVSEEFGEIAEGLAKGNFDLTEDAIGDTYVTLVILAAQLGTSIEACVMKAYDEIKDRTGEMKNGVFVKSEDL